MSYILDALKKSERQRPPGQVPDLFTVQGPMVPGKPRRTRRTAVVVASIVVVAALGGWAWFEARDRQTQPPPARSAAPQLPAPGVAPPETAAPAVPAAATPATTSRPETPPAEKVPAIVLPAPPPTAVPAASRSRPVPAAVEAPAGGASFETAVPSAPELPAAAIPAAAPSPAAASPAMKAPAALVPDVVAVPTTAPEVPAPAPRAVVDEPEASPPQPAADAPPADGRVVSIEELPENVRNDLGTFVVSGHVWSEEPALRLLTVQDRIVREGAEAAPGVRLEEITQNGAVFTVRGWRFRTGF